MSSRNDGEETRITCMKLDKWGEFNCERQRGHEDNKADHRAKVHRAFFNGQCYEWIGMREAKPVKRG